MDQQMEVKLSTSDVAANDYPQNKWVPGYPVLISPTLDIHFNRFLLTMITFTNHDNG